MAPEAPPSGEPSITYDSGDHTSPPDLRLLHYNDVYHIDASSAEPVGGVARFQTLCDFYRDESGGQPGLLTLFSGDAFNPSLESTVTKGAHMVPMLNSFRTDVACVGNHDLDFGVTQYRNLTGQCKFPWLLANVLDPALGEDMPIGGAKKSVMLTATNGLKVGVIGIGEREWLATINSLPPDLIYRSATETVKELAPKLREEGADMVIALTHQREPNDTKLAKQCPEGTIDLILGGHDHFYNHMLVNGCHVLRSGTDFKQLSYLEAWKRPDGSKKWDFRITRRDLVSSIPEDPKMLELVSKSTEKLKSKLEKPIGYTATPLDARFTTVRLKESNIGNFVCDLMRYYYQTDCCIMAAGTIRGDQVYPPGILRLKDVMNCFPFEDPVVVIEVTGQALLDALENSVSLYPALEGRFPQVSHIEFKFDPNQPPGERISDVIVAKEPIDLKRKYKLGTRGYMGRGKDGFDSLLVKSEGGEAEEHVSEENGVLISTIIRQYFFSLKILRRWKMLSPSMNRTWNGIHERLHQRHPLAAGQTHPSSVDQTPLSPVSSRAQHITKPIMDDGVEHQVDESDDEDEDQSSDSRPQATTSTASERELEIMRKVLHKWWRLSGLTGHPSLAEKLGDQEFSVNWTRAISPRLEGRIQMIE